MADQPSIFGNDSTGSNPPAQVPASTGTNVQIDPSIATLLEGIKNDRGEPKYKSLPDALTALQHSQQYIPQLTSTLAEKDAELARLRAEAARVAELERSIQELTRQPSQPQNTPPAGLTEEQIAELVNRTLTKTQREEKERQNIAAVASALKASFGTEAETKYNAKAAEIGMSVSEFNALAARSPQAVLQMLGAKAAPTNVAPNQSTVNTTGLQPQQTTFIGRNPAQNKMGSTSQDARSEFEAAKKMVDEVHDKGLSMYDLSDPKVYFKHFGK